MKKQTLFLIVGAVIMTLLGVLTVVTFNAAIEEDPYTLLFGEEIELKYKSTIESFPGGFNFAYIDNKQVAYDMDGEEIGDVYTIRIRNGYALDTDEKTFGDIELLIGIDLEDKVYASIVTLEQSDWTSLGIQAYILETFNGIPYQDVETLPEYDAAMPTAGATATDSTNTIKELILDVIDIHYGLVVDESALRLARYQSLVSETAAFTELDTTTDPASVAVKAALYDASENLIGYAIEAMATNTYGAIEMVIITDTTGVVVGADFIDLDQSMFQSETTSNLQLYVGTMITDETPDGDLLTSASYSLSTLQALISDISAAFSHIELPASAEELRLESYQEVLSTTASFTNLDTATDPTSIVVKDALYDASDALVGYAIEATATNQFGSIHTLIITDVDGVILSASFVSLNQTMFQSQTTSNLALYVGTSITDETPDGDLLTSASYSLSTLQALIADTSAAFSTIDTEGAGA